MASLKQESGQSSPVGSEKEMVLESGSDSSPLSDGSSPSSPLEVSSCGSSSDSSGGSSSDGSSSGDSSDSSDESSSDDSSNSSIKKKKEPKSTCLLQRLGTTNYKLGLEVEEPKASKKVYFTKDQCRWTMIKHPVSVNGVRNFVLTANNAFVDVLFEDKVMHVDITLGDDLEEKLRISMKASSERNCVTVAEEYQPLEATRCSVLTEDLVNIGSYDPCSGTYPPNGCFGTTDYKLDLQKTRENDGAVEFVTEGDSLLNFSFGEKDGKDTVHIFFAYGKKECHELGFDFEVSGHDLNVVNLPSALATTATATATAPPLSSSLTTTTTSTAPSLCSACTTTTTTTAPLVPLNRLQIMHGCTVMAPGITRKVEEEPVKEVSTTTNTSTSLVHCGTVLNLNLPSALITTTTTTTITAPSLSSAWITTTATTAPTPLVPLNRLQIMHGCTVMAPGITRTVEEEPVNEESTTTPSTTLVHCGKSEVIAEEVMPMQKK